MHGGYAVLGPFCFSQNSSHHTEMEYFSKLTFSWGSPSLEFASAPRLASFLAYDLVMAPSVALPRPVLAQVLTLVLSLAFFKPAMSFLLSFSRCSWGFLSLGVASTPRLASLGACSGTGAFRSAPSTGVSQMLVLSLTLPRPNRWCHLCSPLAGDSLPLT